MPLLLFTSEPLSWRNNSSNLSMSHNLKKTYLFNLFFAENFSKFLYDLTDDIQNEKKRK